VRWRGTSTSGIAPGGPHDDPGAEAISLLEAAAHQAGELTEPTERSRTSDPTPPMKGDTGESSSPARH
jgi:hypothetical protein